MLINIHDIIKNDLTSIKDIWIILKKETAGPTPAVSYISIPNDTLEYDLNDDIVSEHKIIQLKVWFIINGANNIKFYDLKSLYVIENTPNQIKHLIKTKSQSTIQKFLPFFNNKKDLKSIQKHQLTEIITKSKKVDEIENSILGTKNLIYYSAYNDSVYLEMLNLSILSLLKHNSIDKFDILIITDNSTKNKIDKLRFIEKKKPLFHITKTPKDGIEASINKIKIFDYKKINDYQNILYLDCDTAFKGNIDNIFDNIKSDILYTTHIVKKPLFELFKTLTYGFEAVDDDFVKLMKEKKQYPFNAGQFLFKNSIKMQKHFKNLNMFVNNWRGEYFFEQGFMNYYFCGVEITDNEHLVQFVDFYSSDKSIKDLIKPIIHFAGNPLNGESKYYLMDNFFNFSLKKNSFSSFTDDNTGINECLSVVKSKINDVKEIKDENYGNKNLIYYSVFFDNGYIELLDLSLRSLVLTKNINFDILIITDETTQNKIKTLTSLKYFNYNFHLVNTPEDGIDASKTKCDVFDYENINEYSKILFLDTDIVAIDDIKDIFEKDLESEKLYSSRPFSLLTEHFKGIYHGFPCLDKEDIERFKRKNQIGFNAGQFLFKNTTRMQKHFNNIRWFMKNWPSEYFFEQCFMNYYFAEAGTIDQMLYDYVYVAHTSLERHQIFDLEPDIRLIHFTAPPGDAKTKLDYINNNIHRYKKL